MGALTLPDGKRQWYYGQTQREVREKLADARAVLTRGRELATGRQSVAQFLVRWLETVRSTVRPSTFERYGHQVTAFAIPVLGHVRLDRLNGQHLADLYARRERDGASAAYVALLHITLHRAFRDAVRWGLIGANPCDRVDPPRAQQKPKRTLTEVEARRLLAVASEDRLHALWFLAVTTGMRRGELLALHWEDVDLARGQIRVRRTLSRGERGWVEMPPKSARGNRPVTLLPPVVDALRAQAGRLAQARETAGEAWEEGDLVFHSRTGRHLSPAHVSGILLPRLLAQAGIPRIPFHNLRHSTATLLLALGVHPRAVGDLLGHSSISVTMDIYSHSSPTLQQEAVERLGRLLFGE